MYKLVVIDLDGTMLNSYGIVTERTKKVIKEKIKNGTKIVIASGRNVSSIQPIAEEIGCNLFIAGNGSLIYDSDKKEIIYNKYIPKEKVLEIIKKCEENSIFYNIYTDEKIIAKNLKYNVLYYHKTNLNKEENKRTNIIIVEDIIKYIKESCNENFLKIMICDENQTIFNAVKKVLTNVKNVEILDVGHMSRKIIRQGTEEIPIEYYYTEITSEEVDKWNAINFLIKNMNIKKEEIMAIGDNINDKKMIENAGLGVAMQGSTPVLTSVADYITEGNDEDGVANALEKFI